MTHKAEVTPATVGTTEQVVSRLTSRVDLRALYEHHNTYLAEFRERPIASITEPEAQLLERVSRLQVRIEQRNFEVDVAEAGTRDACEVRGRRNA